MLGVATMEKTTLTFRQASFLKTVIRTIFALYTSKSLTENNPDTQGLIFAFFLFHYILYSKETYEILVD